MTHHDVSVADTVPIKDSTRKPTPKCCETAKEAGIWWEDKSLMNGHNAGWTMIENVAIGIRSVWLCNPSFCPFCGAKLSEKP